MRSRCYPAGYAGPKTVKICCRVAVSASVKGGPRNRDGSACSPGRRPPCVDIEIFEREGTASARIRGGVGGGLFLLYQHAQIGPRIGPLGNDKLAVWLLETVGGLRAQQRSEAFLREGCLVVPTGRHHRATGHRVRPGNGQAHGLDQQHHDRRDAEQRYRLPCVARSRAAARLRGLLVHGQRPDS